jgi:hypothetical protein
MAQWSQAGDNWYSLHPSSQRVHVIGNPIHSAYRISYTNCCMVMSSAVKVGSLARALMRMTCIGVPCSNTDHDADCPELLRSSSVPHVEYGDTEIGHDRFFRNPFLLSVAFALSYYSVLNNTSLDTALLNNVIS